MAPTKGSGRFDTEDPDAIADLPDGHDKVFIPQEFVPYEGQINAECKNVLQGLGCSARFGYRHGWMKKLGSLLQLFR
jgi:hypothetical protein